MKSIRTYLKKAGSFACSLLMATGMVNLATISGVGNELAGLKTVHAADDRKESGTAKIKLERLLNHNSIPEIDRPSNEGLWGYTANGKRTFCIDSGASLCTGDKVSYKRYNAVTFANKSDTNKALAKALKYYFTKSNQSKRDKLLVQAYIWALGKEHASRSVAVRQASRNYGKAYSQSEAEAFCKKIAKMEVSGSIYAYKVTYCPRGKKHSAHQSLYGWSSTSDDDGGPSKPKYDKVSDSGKARVSKSVTLNILKKDAKTGEVLAGATFDLYRDGKKVKTLITDAKGKATYSAVYDSGYSYTKKVEKSYVKNWKELSKEQKKAAQNKGYYKSKAAAKSAVDDQVKKDVEKKEKELKENWSHMWKIQETKSPLGYLIGGKFKSKTAEEVWDTKILFDEDIEVGTTLEIENTPKEYALTIQKVIKADEGYDVKRINLSGTIFTVYNDKGKVVGKIATDADGNGSLKGLHAGKYKIKETRPPVGCIPAKDGEVTIKEDGTIEGSGTEYEVVNQKTLKIANEVAKGKIRIYKEYTVNDDLKVKPEPGAVFELYDESGKKVDTLVTDEDGNAESKEHPYGNYTLKQKEGMKGVTMASDKIIKIDADNTEEARSYHITDRLQKYPMIRIQKTSIEVDPETGVNMKNPEPGAVFQIIEKATGKVIYTLEPTDETGETSTPENEDKLIPGNIYIIHQIKASKGFDLCEDKEVEIEKSEEGEEAKVYDFALTNYTRNLKIKKTMGSDKRAESGAEFAILDAEKMTALKDSDLASADSRQAYVEKNAAALIRTLTTNDDGEAYAILDDIYYDHDFVVLQTKGAEGYALADPYESKDHNYVQEEGTRTYEFSANDPYEEFGRIKVKKEYTVSDTETAPEPNAVFEILDEDMTTVVDTLTTNEKGETKNSKELLLGHNYYLNQTKGVKGHEKIEMEKFQLESSQKGKTFVFHRVDKEEEVRLEVKKSSTDSDLMLPGAVFGVYQEDGELAAELVTGEDGTASCHLPYGTYTVKELQAPDGYRLSKKVDQIDINAGTVLYDSVGSPYCEITKKDEPVRGKIQVAKQGQVLTGASDVADGTKELEYETAYIPGAVYGLYAAEDIVKDDGSLVWAKDTLIDKKTTTDSKIYFTWTKNGEETEEFYLGKYYVKEISAPDGFVLDTTREDVELNYDVTPRDTVIEEDDTLLDAAEGIGMSDPQANTGDYVLATGEFVNQKLKDARSVTFTWEQAPAGASVVDVSANAEAGTGTKGTVVLWKDHEDYYISTQKTDQVIFFNAVSSHMFDGCSGLEEIRFDNVETNDMVDMSYMFKDCTGLTSLDLSDFNTALVQDVRGAFEGCSAVQTIYVSDDAVSGEETEGEKTMAVSAMAKNTFLAGDAYQADDFFFYGQVSYRQGAVERKEYDTLTVTADDVTIDPVAAQMGAEEVTITFKKDVGLVKAGTAIRVPVTVEETKDVEVKKTETVIFPVSFVDEAQKINIDTYKVDEEGKALKDAVIGLYAANDIVNVKGEVIVKKDSLLATSVSTKESHVEFADLPTGVYNAAGKDAPMYYVKEVAAPAGYVKSDQVITFSGKADDSTKRYFVHDVEEKEETEESTDVAYIHDSEVIKNKKSDHVQIQKIWKDNDDAYGTRPDAITVTVTRKDGSTKDYTLYARDNWIADTDISLEEYSSDPSAFTFSEKNVGFYKKTNEGYDDSTGTYGMTNTVGDKIPVAVKKAWQDEEDKDKIRPASIEVQLYQNGTSMGSAYKKTLSAANDWYETFGDLPVKDASGSYYEYTVEEISDAVTGNAATGYESLGCQKSVEGDTTVFTITNRHSTEKTVNVSLVKEWDDKDDAEGVRPDRIEVSLYADDVRYGTYIVKEGEKDTMTAEDGEGHWIVDKDASGNLRLTIKGLPKEKDGTEIAYTWKEAKVEGYTSEFGEAKVATVNGEESLLTGLTNHYTGTSVNVGFVKVWDDEDDQAGIRPDSMQAVLYADGKEYGTYTLKEGLTSDKKEDEEGYFYIEKDNEENLRLIVKNLPAKKAGKEIRYTWKEVADDIINGEEETGYRATYASLGMMATGAGEADMTSMTKITNTHMEEKSTIRLTKVLSREKLSVDRAPYTVTFTLTGTDKFGGEHEYEKKVVFDKQEVKEALEKGTSLEKSVEFTDLLPGTYESKETMTDAYFKLVSLKSRDSGVTVKDGVATFDLGAGEEKSAAYTNQVRGGAIHLKKKDGKGRALKGATFRLYDEHGNALKDAVTDEEGNADFEDLAVGTYTIREIKGVAGHTLLKEPVTVTIPLVMTEEEVQEKDADVTKAVKDGERYYFFEVTYTITNEASLSLPQTGAFEDWKPYAPLAAGLGLIGAATYCFLKKKKRP